VLLLLLLNEVLFDVELFLIFILRFLLINEDTGVRKDACDIGVIGDNFLFVG
jgi:hypothetical protein